MRGLFGISGDGETGNDDVRAACVGPRGVWMAAVTRVWEKGGAVSPSHQCEFGSVKALKQDADMICVNVSEARGHGGALTAG